MRHQAPILILEGWVGGGGGEVSLVKVICYDSRPLSAGAALAPTGAARPNPIQSNPIHGRAPRAPGARERSDRPPPCPRPPGARSKGRWVCSGQFEVGGVVFEALVAPALLFTPPHTGRNKCLPRLAARKIRLYFGARCSWVSS